MSERIRDAYGVGARLRQMRQKSGLHLRDVSARCGVSIGHISDIERAAASPSLDVVAKIAAVYGQRVEMRIEDAPPTDDPHWLNGGY
jgi:transcriptional regulator with XRE-family HTH domain